MEMEKEIIQVAKRAAEIMLEAKDVFVAAEKGSPRNIVTRYDIRIQEYLAAELGKLVPDAVFIGEETGLNGVDLGGRFFIVDPIDGTSNFSKGSKRSCVSIAYGEAGSVVCGVVCDPYLDEVFSATVNEGSRLNGLPINSMDNPLEHSIVCFGTCPYDLERTDVVFEAAKEVFKRSLDLRRTGSAALEICYTALNRYDAFFEYILYPWDYAAASLIVSEAGGVAVNMDGNSISLARRDSVVTGAPTAVAEILEIVCREVKGL